MWRRYLVSLVGALAGAAVPLMVGLDYRTVAVIALAVAGAVMAFGERIGLVPASEDVGRPMTLFSDDKGRRR